MPTKTTWRTLRVAGLLLGACAGLLAVPAHAQSGSPQRPESKSSSSAPSAAGAPGSGAGVHSPNSPFPPLKDRADVLPWSLLTSVKTQVVKNRVLPVFPPDVQALAKTRQRVQGFMMPLEPGERQRHFLLSAVPLSCSFCVPGGPESMVEVRTQTPVKYTMEPVVVEGPLSLLEDDKLGLYYRMLNAVPVE